MKSVLCLAAVGAALVGGAAASRTEAESTRASKSPVQPVLGISYRAEGRRAILAWFDPLTLEKLPGRKAPLGARLGSWAFSADRAVLAMASCDPPELRFVNARQMRVLGFLQLSRYPGCADSLTWLRPDRLLAVVSAAGQSELVVVDPIRRRTLVRTPLPSYPAAIGRTEDALVLVLATWGSFAPARIVVADAEGTVRGTTVDRVLEGNAADESAGIVSRSVRPGLAVDPEGRRAFLMPASGAIAEIDLRTLAVSYHELDAQSLFRRFLRWLTPAAQAKAMEGPVREARWLGDGMVAVSGTDWSIATDGRGEPVEADTPAGARLIDTRSWTSHLLSADASSVAVAPGVVIAHGGGWDLRANRNRGPGVLAFGLDGRELWRLHAGEYRWIDQAGSVGYVHDPTKRVEIVDLETGLVLGAITGARLPETWPELLAAESSGW